MIYYAPGGLNKIALVWDIDINFHITTLQILRPSGLNKIALGLPTTTST